MFEKIISLIDEKTSLSEIDEIAFSKENRQEYIDEIIKLSDRVKDGEDYKKIRDELAECILFKNFREYIDNDLKNNLAPYLDTQFIRDLDYDKQCKILKDFFEETIIRVSSKKSIEQNSEFSKDELESLVGVLQTARTRIVIKRYKEEFFKSYFYDMFRFENNLISFLWSLFDERRNEIMMYVLMDMYTQVKEIDNTTYKMYKIFSELVEDDE